MPAVRKSISSSALGWYDNTLDSCAGEYAKRKMRPAETQNEVDCLRNMRPLISSHEAEKHAKRDRLRDATGQEHSQMRSHTLYLMY